MSSNRVTGAQARELLREFNDPNGTMRLEKFHDVVSTLAWLHGREHAFTHYGGGASYFGMKGNYEVVEWAVEGDPREGEVHISVYPDSLTPDEAVDLARALLAAAEVARRPAN